MAVNPYIVLDLMKPANVLTDLTPNFQGRVGDSGSIIKIWFQMNGLPYGLDDKEVWFAGVDPQGERFKVSSTIDDTTPGDSLRSGRVSFKFPAGTFSNPGDWDANSTFFQIKQGSDGTVLSTINVKLHVLDNNVDFGVTKHGFDTDLDKIEQAAQNEYNTMVQQWHDQTASLNQTMTDDYASYKQRIDTMQTLLDTISSAIKNQDVATREYVAKYIAGDLLGTATIDTDIDHMFLTGHVRIYTNGFGVGKAGETPAGGSAVYEAQCRLVYLTPELVQVYVSTEQLADLMPGWSMVTPPKVTIGNDTAYLTSDPCSLAVQLQGVKAFNGFTVDGKFQVNADRQPLVAGSGTSTSSAPSSTSSTPGSTGK